MTERALQRVRIGKDADWAAFRPAARQNGRATSSGGALGNQTRLRRLAAAAPRLQAKLEVGAVDDPLEREADAAADQAMRMAAPPAGLSPAPPGLSRKCAECEDEKKPVQRAPAGGTMAAGGGAPAIVHEVVSGPAKPLDRAVSAFMSPRLGHDFSDVRIHTDARADASARAVGAWAYTVGRDVVFASGRYQPGAEDGRRLIAHELAHVAQQGASPHVVRRDGPDVPLKEAKVTDATGAVAGGLKTVADQAGKNEAFKSFALDLAKKYALPVWNGASDADKAAIVAGGTAIVGTGLASLLSDPTGRSKLSGINFLAPLSLVPYATLSGFSYDLPKTKTDPVALHFSFKADDLLKLAHDKLSYVPPVTASFDITLGVGPDGKVTTPSALAKFGVLPGVTVAGGYGVTADLPPLVSGGGGQPLAPNISYPQPAQPAPPGGLGVFVAVDLLKAPILPKAVRAALGGDPGDKKSP
jgi:hypothetical protein